MCYFARGSIRFSEWQQQKWILQLSHLLFWFCDKLLCNLKNKTICCMQHKFWDINGVVPVQRITGWPQQCFIYIEVRIKLLWINLLGIKAFFSTFFWSEPWSLDLLAVSGNENCLLSLRTMSFFVEPCQMKQSELINSFGLPLINWQNFETKLGVNKLLLCEMYSLLFF